MFFFFLEDVDVVFFPKPIISFYTKFFAVSKVNDHQYQDDILVTKITASWMKAGKKEDSIQWDHFLEEWVLIQFSYKTSSITAIV